MKPGCWASMARITAPDFIWAMLPAICVCNLALMFSCATIAAADCRVAGSI